MGFRRQYLQEAFFVPGTYAFRVYGYGTADPLEAVLRPGYFDAARSQLRPGELIFVNACAGRPPRHGEATAGAGRRAARAALVMVSENTRGGPVAARLVQDFGGPDGAPPATIDPERPPVATPRRGRGRPPGSRTKSQPDSF